MRGIARRLPMAWSINWVLPTTPYSVDTRLANFRRVGAAGLRNAEGDQDAALAPAALGAVSGLRSCGRLGLRLLSRQCVRRGAGQSIAARRTAGGRDPRHAKGRQRGSAYSRVSQTMETDSVPYNTASR